MADEPAELYAPDRKEELFREAVQAMRDHIPAMPDTTPVTKENITSEELKTIRSMYDDGLIRVDSMIGLFSGRELTGMKALEILGKADSVNHPSHYTAYKGLEIIDLTEQMNFNRGNAVKYIARAGLKNKSTEIEDLEKARWYIQREIDRLRAAGADEQSLRMLRATFPSTYMRCDPRVCPGESCVLDHG